MSKNDIKTDICVIGGGLVGLTAALKLAQTGAEIVICTPNQTTKDPRTTAFLMQSVDFFEKLGLWEKLAKKAFPLKTMRIVDGTRRLIRAPQTNFMASEIDLDAFGYNLKNSDLVELLEMEIKNQSNISTVDGTIEEIKSLESREVLIVNSGAGQSTIDAGFIVGADGTNSIVRNKKEISIREWEYPQTAIVLDFEHSRTSQYTSTEFHTEAGPFTIVPHTQHLAGLVWMEKPEKVEELLALPNKKLETVLEDKMQSFLGKVKLVSRPKSFPIKGLVTNSFGNSNWAIIGEAAHVFPPIGAQGFNLGVRDIEALFEVLSRFTNQDNRGLQYDSTRKTDINTRTLGVDLLNRSLLSDFLPVQLLRGIGLQVLGSIKPLRKFAMKKGISPNM